MKRRVILIVLGVAVVALAGAAFLVFQVFSGDVPEEAALSSPTTSATSGDAGAPSGGFAGTWTLDTSSRSLDDGSSTFAGYRVDEELSTIGSHTAVGRTNQVTGSMTLSGSQVTALDVTVDMTTLASDDDRRDNQLRERGIQTDAFPTAAFTLTQPIDVGQVPAEGKAIDATASGDLTLHGVTRHVDVPVQARWTGSRIEIAGSVGITLADYQIEKPVGFIVLSIGDTGTIEFHLLFEKS